jgi:two-component system NarL family sensor kinase
LESQLSLFVQSYRMRKSLIILLFHLLPEALYSQVLMNKDSLLKLLPLAKEDTNAVKLYINIGQQLDSSEPNVGKMYYKKAGDLSRKLNYPRGIIKYISNYTFVLNMQGLYDSSLLLNLEGVAIARKTRDSSNLAGTLFNTGTSYSFLGEFDNAVRYYEEGRRIFEKYGNKVIEAQCNDILQVLYFNMGNYPKAIELGEKSVAAFREIGDKRLLGIALSNLGLSYAKTNKIDRAVALFTEALKIGGETDDKNLQVAQYLNLCDVALREGEYEKVKHYADKALIIARELNLHESELIAMKGLSFYYAYRKEYKLAKEYAAQALTISYRFNFKSQRAKVFTQLSNLAYVAQDMPLGEYYASQSELLGDSLINETIHLKTAELDKKYESEKKESHIVKLETEKKVQQLSLQRRSIFNYMLVGGILVLGIISLLTYRTYKQKQKLQQQRISELETEKQLTATEAVLKGEEQERTRLAKDLHDGLGGMLSGIKYSFNTMKENLIMTPENHQAFERSMDMLDSSIKEMRRVAHNMMPESLIRFGLDTALKDFCNDINQSGALEVSYQSIGLEHVNLEQTTAITIYRIVQELISNVLKHASAKSIIVQVANTSGHISVTVEDDGSGFDTAILKNSKGIGWTNIQHRLDFIKAKLDVSSQPGKGTSVHIEFDV